MQKFSPAFARKQMRAEERRKAKAKEAAFRAARYLRRQFGLTKEELRPEQRRRDVERIKYLFKWARWDFYVAETTNRYGGHELFFIFHHPSFGGWEWEIKQDVIRVRDMLRRAGFDV